MKNLIRTAVAAGALALAASAPAAAAAPESDEPIILTLHDWSGQYITTTIMGNVLKSMGYNVEYVQADYLAQFAGIETGDLTVAMAMASWPGYITMTQRPKQHHSGTFY